MATGYEVKMYQDLSNIAQSLNRIANCMEAGEKRAREHDNPVEQEINRRLGETCHIMGCEEPVIVTINDSPFCMLHVDQGFVRAREVVRRAVETQQAFENVSIQDRVELRKQEARKT